MSPPMVFGVLLHERETNRFAFGARTHPSTEKIDGWMRFVKTTVEMTVRRSDSTRMEFPHTTKVHKFGDENNLELQRRLRLNAGPCLLKTEPLLSVAGLNLR